RLLTEPAGSSDVHLFAKCALDVLGIPLMLRRPALVTSTNPLGGESVRVPLGGGFGRCYCRRRRERPAWLAGRGGPRVRSGLRPCRGPHCGYARDRVRLSLPGHEILHSASLDPPKSEAARRPGDILLAPSRRSPAAALQRAERRFGCLPDRLPEAET